jgi:hypothetical protein
MTARGKVTETRGAWLNHAVFSLGPLPLGVGSRQVDPQSASSSAASVRESASIWLYGEHSM